MLAYITGTPMVKKFEGVGKPRLAATTSLFGLLGSQDEFLDPTGHLMRTLASRTACPDRSPLE
jgi:hypothetical protein